MSNAGKSTPTDSITAYRKRVVMAHKREFEIHTSVASLVETAATRTRSRPTLVHLVLDMLLLQSVKTHAGVSVLAQLGIMEDTATLARRLMEISVQAVYIGAESDAKTQTRRAGSYLAHLWRGIPRHAKLRLPPKVREEWSSVARSYGRFVRKGAKRWGPTFRTMFTDIGSEDLYLTDYAFLSSIAHGAGDNQIFQFSVSKIRMHDHKFAPVLLMYASRYHLTTAEQWDSLYALIDKTKQAAVVKEVLAWRHRKAGR